MKNRPHTIQVKYLDPFDSLVIAESNYPYSARFAAKSIYSKKIRQMKNALRSIQAMFLEGRTPIAKITFLK